MAEAPATRPVAPAEWVRVLGGEVVHATGPSWGPLQVGHYRFRGRPEPFSAPPLGRHYVSMTLDGATPVLRDVCGDRVFARFAPGQCLTMAAGQENGWRWDRPTEEIHFYLCPDYLDGLARSADAGGPALIDRFAFRDTTLGHIAATVLGELEQGGSADRLWIEAACQLFASHLLRHHVSRPVRELARGGLAPAQLRRVRGFVAESLASDISLADMSGIAGVSPFHFARMFRASTGEPPHRWLTGERIARAKELLRHTNLPVSEIAAEVGFRSQSHFGQAFRRFTGATPRAWRRDTRH